VSGVPLVSIAIRAFRRRWLGEAIASVLAQTHGDLELVVYDDAGDLEDVADGFGDRRVRYHRAAERLDAAGRYGAAVALCRGTYIGVLDDDDYYEPEFVARLVAALAAEPRAGVAVSRNVRLEEGRLIELHHRRPPGIQSDPARAFLECRWIVTPSTALIRRSALLAGERELPMPAGVTPDLFVNVRAAAGGWEFVLVDELLVVTRWHDEQLSRSIMPSLDRAVATWQALRIADAELEQLRLRQLAHSHVARAAWRLIGGDARGARDDLRLARTVDPQSSPWKRRALAAAAAAPPAGRAGLRVWAASPRVAGRRSG
jgi:glycosyltransferase involved in cell wall biosynthesis